MAHPESIPETIPVTGRRPVVVAVDDDPAVLRSLRRILPNDRYDLLTTTDPDEALDRVARLPVDVFITDQRMPGIAGTDLLRVVEQQSPKTRRVVLSAFPDPTAGGSLVQHFIPKPWNDDLLRAIVRRMTGERRRETAIRPEAFMKEVPILAECGDRRGAEILPRFLRVFRKARRDQRGILALLEQLPALKDDPGSLLADLDLGATMAGVNLSLVDRSGMAARYYRLRGLPSPNVSVHGRPAPADSAAWLLVDAAPARRVFLKLLLEGLGRRCRAVASVEEANRLSGSERFGRILVDMTEPYEALNWIGEIAGRPGRPSIVPLLPTSLTWWDPEVFARWRLDPPLRRPYGLNEILGFEDLS